MLQRYDPRNADLLVNVGGKLVHLDQAGVSPFDSISTDACMTSDASTGSGVLSLSSVP